jgi:hypothetical protein
MNPSELLAKLTQKGVQFWVEENKLNIRSPKGVITPELQAEISMYKEDILALLQEMNINNISEGDNFSYGISLQTIGRLIGGFTGETPIGYQPPMIEPKFMAQNLKITFRPLPQGYHQQKIIQFRQELAMILQNYGVQIFSWQEATTDVKYEIKLPLLNIKKKIILKGVKREIDAVIDVERPNSWLRKIGILIAEFLYLLSYDKLAKNRQLNVIQIAKLSSWAEDHAAKYVEDPTNTQIVVITDIDYKFIGESTSYGEKINIGVNTLIKTFSEIVIGVSDQKISILNMNLSDSIFERKEIKNFAIKSLIPKIFVPIAPLLMNRFAVGMYNPLQSEYAEKLVQLGKKLSNTGLFPPGFKLAEVLKRQSHRDIVNVIVNGRTGVSYGFLAYAEPPVYIGNPELTANEWEKLIPVPGFNSHQLRQNDAGRKYIKLDFNGDFVFKQIPDIWLVSSRSGANKTNLSIETDVLRIGLHNGLHLQLPIDTLNQQEDIKPSYDIYVMLAISLAAALYTPNLIKNGAPIVHFHGYPTFDWFQKNEYCFGVNNPSVPCGTYESGVLNFLGIANLANQNLDNIHLIGLIEPDHGTNFIAHDLNYLVERLQFGCKHGQIELGGRNFASLKANFTES